MGQTLTHGIYLPDEGERNCYNGLAANWSILDGAVGTIAEHTSALAGKAPLVHTHTKSDITDFPVYGTTAGTICEGNDSRLSDARTPVAHTHTKSDVTDLLNSNFIPSANNSYDLGSSSYQWNNLYAKNYYYNGTAWGLDKANTWSGSNTFTNSFVLKNTSWSGKVPPSSRKIVEISLSNSDTVQSRVVSRVDANSTETWITTIRNIDANASYESTLIHTVDNNGNRKLQPLYGDVSLGASDFGSRFKTLNGINPGALSLPDYTLAKVDLIDFSQWSVAGQPNEYMPISDGWLFVNIKDTASNSIFIYAHGLYNADPTKATDYSVSCFGNGSQGVNGRIAVMIPVRAGIAYRVYIRAASVSEIWSARFYPALGNV